MKKPPISIAGLLIAGTALLAVAFFAGRSSTESERSTELRRALGYYRWTLTIPSGSDGSELSLLCRNGDQQWSTGGVANVVPGQRFVIFVRRDLHTKRMEYTILSDKVRERGTVADPIDGGKLFVDRPEGECRPDDFLLAGGDEVKLDQHGTHAERMVAVILKREKIGSN